MEIPDMRNALSNMNEAIGSHEPKPIIKNETAIAINNQEEKPCVDSFSPNR
jgi:hypothetical protein